MRKSILVLALALGYIGGTSSAQAALAEHFQKTVSILEASDSTCIFFQLTGVTEANPAADGGRCRVSSFAVIVADIGTEM